MGSLRSHIKQAGASMSEVAVDRARLMLNAAQDGFARATRITESPTWLREQVGNLRLDVHEDASQLYRMLLYWRAAAANEVLRAVRGAFEEGDQDVLNIAWTMAAKEMLLNRPGWTGPVLICGASCTGQAFRRVRVWDLPRTPDQWTWLQAVVGERMLKGGSLTFEELPEAKTEALPPNWFSAAAAADRAKRQAG